MSVLEKITMVPFSTNQYFDEESQKVQIYLHHTASSPNPYGVVNWWETTPDRIATAFIIGGKSTNPKWKDGDILQVFGSGKWAWHLGLTAKHLAAGGSKALSNKDLNKKSIGIEICNWGQLTKTDKGFKTYAGTIVADSDVCELSIPYKGFKYYEKYTSNQLDNTFELLKFLGNKWNIPVSFKGDRIFNVCPEALQGESGIWTHTSVRNDKFDCYPQPELIQMLTAL